MVFVAFAQLGKEALVGNVAHVSIGGWLDTNGKALKGAMFSTAASEWVQITQSGAAR